LVLLFPLSIDPLRQLPASRLALWPLTRREHWILRFAGPWINPLTWALAGLAIWSVGRTISIGLWAMLAGMFVAAFALSHVPAPGRVTMWRRVPGIPGPLEQLVRKNLREVLSTLDFYCALILSLAVVAWRILRPSLPPEPLIPIPLLLFPPLSPYPP